MNRSSHLSIKAVVAFLRKICTNCLMKSPKLKPDSRSVDSSSTLFVCTLPPNGNTIQHRVNFVYFLSVITQYFDVLNKTKIFSFVLFVVVFKTVFKKYSTARSERSAMALLQEKLNGKKAFANHTRTKDVD